MKRLLVIFLFFASLVVSSKPLDSLRLELKQGKKFIVYRVLKGERIEDIALKYETEESTLLSMNPLIQTEVKPGQIIKIPLNLDKYGDIPVPEVKPIEYMAMPLASSLPPPSQKQLPSKQLMTTTTAIPTEVKLNPEPVNVAPSKPKSAEPVILGEPVAIKPTESPTLTPTKPPVSEPVILKPTSPTPIVDTKPTEATPVVQIPVPEVNKKTDKVTSIVSSNTPSTLQKEPTQVAKEQEVVKKVISNVTPVEIAVSKYEEKVEAKSPNKIVQSPSQAPVLQDTLKVASVQRYEARDFVELSSKGMSKLAVKPVQNPSVNLVRLRLL